MNEKLKKIKLKFPCLEMGIDCDNCEYECEYNERIKKLEEQIQELKRENDVLIKKAEFDYKKGEGYIQFNEAWRPKTLTRYFFIDANGYIDDFVWNSHSCHAYRFDFGNCFQTYQQAEQRAKEIRVYNLLKNFSEANKTIDNGYWQIICNLSNNTFYIDSFVPAKNMVFGLYVYFTSKEVAEEALRRYKTELEELVK